MNLAEEIFTLLENKDNVQILRRINESLDKINDTYADWTALGHAIHAGNLEVVKHLIEKGADIKIGAYNCLFACMLSETDQNTKIEILKLLIEAGADINEPLNKKTESLLTRTTLLDFAAISQQGKIFDYLIGKGAVKEKTRYPQFVNEYHNSRKTTMAFLKSIHRHKKSAILTGFSSIHSQIPKPIVKEIAQYTIATPDSMRAEIIQSIQNSVQKSLQKLQKSLLS